MEKRTRQQEYKYLQALGYVWGRKDGTPYSSPNATFILCCDSMAFAAWYAVDYECVPLEDAFGWFLDQPMQEQKRLGQESQRMAWSPYDDYRKAENA